MTRRLHLVVISCFLIISGIHAQKWQWAKDVKTERPFASINNTHRVITDSTGNTYTVGAYSGTTTVEDQELPAIQGTSSLYITKHNATGNLVWVFPIVSGMMVFSSDIRFDNQGNIIVGGGFFQYAIIGKDTLRPPTDNRNIMDYFLIKFTPAGEPIAVIQGKDPWHQFSGLGVDPENNIYVEGSYYGTPGYVFITKYDAKGNRQWTEKVTPGNNKNAECGADKITINGVDDIYILGHFVGDLNFGNISLSNYTDLPNYFVARMDKSRGQRAWNWAKHIQASIYYFMGSLTVTTKGPVIAFVPNSDISFDDGTTYSNPTPGSPSTYVIAQLDKTDGSRVWSDYVSTAHARVYGVYADPSDNVYVGGDFFRGSITAGDSTLVNNSDKYTEAFIVKYNKNGENKWGVTFGNDAEFPKSRASVFSMHSLATNQLAVTGEIYNNVRFDSAILGQPGVNAYADFMAVLTIPQTLEILNPLSNEGVESGSKYTIKWKMQNVENINIEFTTNGLVWKTIASNYPADVKNISWNVPNNTVSHSCLIRITDAKNPANSVVSGAFAILSKMEVLYPKGGETFYYGKKDTIAWKGSKGEVVNGEYSTDQGKSWKPLFSDVKDSTYIWTIPKDFSTSCLVKISNSKYSTLTAQSQDLFSILPRIGIGLSTPNGRESYFSGDLIRIEGMAKGIASVTIEYTIDDGKTWKLITKQPCCNEMINAEWIAPQIVSNTCRVRVYNTANPLQNDESESNFTIRPYTIHVVTPNGGEILPFNSHYTITWTANKQDTFKGEFSTDGGKSWNMIFSGIADNSFDWIVPNIYNEHCLIRITSISLPEVNDISDAAFNIQTSITVTSPNGGEIWPPNFSIPVQWSNALPNPATRYKVEFTADGQNWQTLASDQSRTNIFVTIPDINYTSYNCFIRVSDMANPAIADRNDQPFTVQSGGTGESLTGNSQYSLYPNPVESEAIVQFPKIEAKNVKVDIYDAQQNKKVFTKSIAVEDNKIRFNIATLKQGVYILNVTAKDKVLFKQTFLKK